MNNTTVFCQNCGNKLRSVIRICPKCGHDNKFPKLHRNSRRIILVASILIIVFVILGYLIIYLGYVKFPKIIESKLQEFRILPQYIGNDLIRGSIRSRDEGAKNLEAYIEDSRDGKKYRIVKMPDGNWWMAENLNFQKDLVMNERADYANGKEFKNKDNGEEAIGSFWCNDGFRTWNIYIRETFDDMGYEEKKIWLDYYGYKPTIEQAKDEYPGDKGSKNEISRLKACSDFGALYTWDTAVANHGKIKLENDFKSNTIINGVCPEGWKVPSDNDWATLLNSIESQSNGLPDHDKINEDFAGQNGGKYLKSTRLSKNANQNGFIWQDETENIFDIYDPEVTLNSTELYTNFDLYGFGIIPAGGKEFNSFMPKSFTALFWTSTESNNSKAFYRSFDNDEPRVYRGEHEKYFGLSVRCVRK